MMIEHLKALVAKELGVADVTPETSRNNTKAWDSLRHVNLVLAIEREFGVRISHREAMRLMSVRDLTQILESKGVAQSA
jgi:acyl carrier protein